jgi:hypothetical protein
MTTTTIHPTARQVEHTDRMQSRGVCTFGEFARAIGCERGTVQRAVWARRARKGRTV